MSLRTVETANLKPCPFCGGSPQLESYSDCDGVRCYIVIDGCVLTRPVHSRTQAIERWNRRAKFFDLPT